MRGNWSEWDEESIHLTIGYYERLGKNVTMSQKTCTQFTATGAYSQIRVHVQHSLLAAIGGSGVLAAAVQ